MENNNYLIYDHIRNNWKRYNIQHLKEYKFSDNDKKTESEGKKEDYVGRGVIVDLEEGKLWEKPSGDSVEEDWVGKECQCFGKI